MSSSKPAVKAENLVKNFGPVCAVNRVSFLVEPGEIFGLVGPDGAGKTTTMRLLTSVMAPDTGKAWVNGKEVLKAADEIRDEIGYMSQKFGLYLDLTVSENIRFYADIYGVSDSERKGRMERLLSFSRLGPFQDRRAGQLSGGMKQKLGLMCALIHTPKVLFLDEPTSGVDPVSRRDFWKILYRLLQEGVAIVFSTTYLDEAERCARVGLLHHGRLLACESPKTIRKQMTGGVLEIQTPSVRETAAFLLNQYPPSLVNLTGSRIRFISSHPEDSAAELEKLFRDRNLPEARIIFTQPTLEDAFISMIHQSARP